MSVAVVRFDQPHEIEDLAAVDFLKRLPESSIDTLIVDPPTGGGSGQIENVGADADDGVDARLSDLVGVAEETYRVLKPGGSAIALGDPRTTGAWEITAHWAGLSPLASMVVLWDTPRTSRWDGLSLTTPVRWHVKPGCWRREGEIDSRSNVIVCRRGERHPLNLDRPVELYNYLITLSTPRHGSIAIPWCRSGSAAIAAEMTGRRWCAAERDEGSRRRAMRRLKMMDLEDAYLGDLFLWTRRQLVRIGG